MKHFFIALSFLTMLLPLITAYAGDQERTYSIGVVPQFDTRKLHGIWKPILKKIESLSGVKLELVGSPTIPAFEREFMQGDFDFAYMNPYHILLAHESQGYIPLVRDTARQLRGILVVHEGSGIKSIADLDGKSIAFPAPNALGASLMLRAELTDRFKIDFRPVYVKTHSSVYLNVALGEAAAGGGVQKTLDRQSGDVKSRLRVLHRTGAVAPHPVAAHPRVPEDIRRDIYDAFIELGTSETGRAMLARIPINQIGTATMEDYTSLSALGLESYYEK